MVFRAGDRGEHQQGLGLVGIDQHLAVSEMVPIWGWMILLVPAKVTPTSCCAHRALNSGLSATSLRASAAARDLRPSRGCDATELCDVDPTVGRVVICHIEAALVGR